MKLLGFAEELKLIKEREDKIDLEKKARDDFDVLQQEIARNEDEEVPSAQPTGETQEPDQADDLS